MPLSKILHYIKKETTTLSLAKSILKSKSSTSSTLSFLRQAKGYLFLHSDNRSDQKTINLIYKKYTQEYTLLTESYKIIQLTLSTLDYLSFNHTFKKDLLLSVKEIRKVEPHFNKTQLVQWQQKGYITNIARGYYLFSDVQKNEQLLMYISNRLLLSYVSLETALSYYGFIPEGVYVTTAITTLLPRKWETAVGSLWYQMVKPSYFFGYTYLAYQEKKILIAEPEKAILDYVYLHTELKTENDFEELRLNPLVWKEKINREKLETYLQLMNNKALSERTTQLITYMNTYDEH